MGRIKIMHNNDKMNKAKRAKNDEFYTRYEDVKYYMNFWKDYLKNKIIYCPFDTSESAFVKYFKEELKAGRIRELIYTSNNYEENGGIFDYVSKNGGVVISNPPFSIYNKIINYFKRYDIKYIMIGPYIKICTKLCYMELTAKTLWRSYTIIEEFSTPTGEKKGVACNWYNNIRSTQKEEKKEDLRLKKLKQFEKHDIKYDKTGEPLEYKNVLYCDTLYEYTLADINNFDFVILPVTSIGDEDLLENLEFIKMVRIKVDGNLRFQRVLFKIKHTGVI